MKKDVVEYLGFDDEHKNKVGRPKLADEKTKKKSLIIASVSFIFVILLLIFGYGTLFGFKNLNLKATSFNNEINNSNNILIDEIKPLVKDITLKTQTARKIYLTILPASATNKSISYESSDTSVATVNNEGKVIGVSVGNAIITAKTTDGTNLSTEFNIKVIKNADGKCMFSSVSKTTKGIEYSLDCNNAKVKEIQYKVGNENYEKLLTKKNSDIVKLSKEQMNKKITFKVVYYPNNSKITKYETKTIESIKNTTKAPTGSCSLDIKEVKATSAKYDISCDNASVTKIAYKIGNGSYVGLEPSSLADTILFENSDITRVIYFNIEYVIDGTNIVKTLSKNSIIEKSYNN